LALRKPKPGLVTSSSKALILSLSKDEGGRLRACNFVPDRLGIRV
jgi:hypothetical protein